MVMLFANLAGFLSAFAGSGRLGVLRSEVKEEGWAKPSPGDMSGAEHPSGLITARLAGLNDRKNGLAQAKRLGALLPLMSPVGFASSSFTSLQQHPESLGDRPIAASLGVRAARSVAHIKELANV
ncbi:hypothetical protein DBR47_21285 [Paucibacter sp. KBW04]|uniref:hypothetical protein n=1 Tax=Paucibacter sp. KBW04 TaxID=2153361 RepID=UPI000F55E0C3|nr:hypothetical protein [Paucibacter sp. KBW04]RQO55391.1 hypothetical protein DBR47_21285 [Paucibacter sp. KBW04]